ncbi:threonine synthase [Actinomadura madurae]|uniref:threonine synthase n=1 Tax=Actinomadura madurae TaxID=1993 RepID=UPI002025DF5E|nr:threonine synthase [Actinomadura madurae]URN02948.1 threonine synthase [Actinomadura madurae]
MPLNADFVMNSEVLVCRRHGVAANPEVPWLCGECGTTLSPPIDDVVMDAEALRERPRNIYRMRELLPVGPMPTIGLHTGWTPLVHARRLGGLIGLENLYLKLDCYNWPSFSYKDRVVAMALQYAFERGASTVACVSTGNVGNSLASLAAAANMRAVVFYPSGIEPAKNVVSSVHGAEIFQLQGTFDQVNAICRELALKGVVPFVNLDLRPFYAEGAKTIAYEVVEQLGWRQPSNVIVPVAGATLLTRIAHGFEEMSRLGMTAAGGGPRIHAAQAAGCAPVADAFEHGESAVRPCVPDTLAKSLAIGNPTDGKVALDLIGRSNGSASAISDEEIVESIGLLASTEGVFTEPAGGVVVATARRLARAGIISPEETVVAVISGNGLKAQEVVASSVERVTRLPADADTVTGALIDAL